MVCIFTRAFDDTASADSSLACNTEKDKGSRRKMERTAGIYVHCTPMLNLKLCLEGILAGIWPCGVVVFIAELFQSESCSQVYGSFHELLRRNDASLLTLSELLIG